MLQFVSYTVSHQGTYDIIHNYVDIPVFLPKTLDMYKYLEMLYPMYTVYIENIGKINDGMSDAERYLNITAEDIDKDNNLLDALCLGTPLDEDVYQYNVAHEPTLFGNPIITTNITPVDNNNEYNGEEDIDHYNPGLSTPDFKGE